METLRRFKSKLIPTCPKYLEIADITDISRCTSGLIIVPTYYDCEVYLSAYVVQRLIKWAISNNFIRVNGAILIPTGNRKAFYNVSSKEKDDETQTSPSVSTPNEID